MLNKVDAAVKKETFFIAGVVLVLSLLMQAVYLIIGQWNYTVLLGNLLGAALAIGNFFFMGLTIQHSLNLEEKDARAKMKLSQQMRMLIMALICGVGALLPCFDLVAVLIPLIFPRIGVTIRGMMMKNETNGQ